MPNRAFPGGGPLTLLAVLLSLFVTRSATAGSNDCDDGTCGPNAPYLYGHQLGRLDLRGGKVEFDCRDRKNPDAVGYYKILPKSFRLKRGRHPRARLVVAGGELAAMSGDKLVAGPGQLEGASVGVQIKMCGRKLIRGRLVIAGVRKEQAALHKSPIFPQLGAPPYAYDFRFRRYRKNGKTLGPRKRICNRELPTAGIDDVMLVKPASRRRDNYAMVVTGRKNPTVPDNKYRLELGTHDLSQTLEIGCNASIVYKMKYLGMAVEHALESAKGQLQAALIWALAAKYCNCGRFTVEGTPIAWTYIEQGKVAESVDFKEVEAAWTPQGLVCLNRPRHASLAKVRRRCGTLPRCGNDLAAIVERFDNVLVITGKTD